MKRVLIVRPLGGKGVDSLERSQEYAKALRPDRMETGTEMIKGSAQ